jgi:hypothetical protein
LLAFDQLIRSRIGGRARKERGYIEQNVEAGRGPTKTRPIGDAHLGHLLGTKTGLSRMCMGSLGYRGHGPECRSQAPAEGARVHIPLYFRHDTARPRNSSASRKIIISHVVFNVCTRRRAFAPSSL